MTVPIAPPNATTAVATRPGLIRRVIRRPLSVVALAYLALIIICSVFASAIAPYGPEDGDFTNVLSGPTGKHWLGTDSLGRDVLSRLMFGGRPALLEVVVAVAVALAIGVPTGLAAVLSSATDRVVRPVVDLAMSIPAIVLLLMVLATFNQNMYAAMVALGILTSPGLIRVVRAAALSVVEEPYVEAARVFGLSRTTIAFRHVLPRIIGPILVNVSLIASSALIAEAGLNYLGLGVHLPAPSWGGMVADAATVVSKQSFLLIPTGGILALTIIAFVLLGDGVRDSATESWSSRSDAVRHRRVAPSTAKAVRDDESQVDDARDSLLRIRNLSVSYPAADGELVAVVERVSFDVRRGESLGIVGESGCGKTTVGLAVLGLTPPAAVVEGVIEFNGVDLLAMKQRDRSALRGSTIAFVSQEPATALDPLFTVGSQLAEAVKTHLGLSRRAAAARALELLTSVKINDPQRVAGLYPHQISGGMAQRVSIAIALAGSPDLLIADEPTTALDVTVQAEIIALLTSLQAETGMAVLIISHDWGVIGEVCSRAVVMYAGEVVERATPEQIFSRPMHPYSAGMLAADPHFAKPGERLATIPGTVPAPRDWPTSCHFHGRCPLGTPECAAAPIPLVAADAESRQSRCIHIDQVRMVEYVDG